MSRLGPKARAALNTAIDTAMRAAAAARKVDAAERDRLRAYAAEIVGTALILDSAEAQAADRAGEQDPQ